MIERDAAFVASLGLPGLQALSEALGDAVRVGSVLEGAGMGPDFSVTVISGSVSGRITVGISADDGNGGRREYAQCVRDWSGA
jgi:hypothetical protein